MSVEQQQQQPVSKPESAEAQPVKKSGKSYSDKRKERQKQKETKKVATSSTDGILEFTSD
jgi:hypothetical protein